MRDIANLNAKNTYTSSIDFSLFYTFLLAIFFTHYSLWNVPQLLWVGILRSGMGFFLSHDRGPCKLQTWKRWRFPVWSCVRFFLKSHSIRTGTLLEKKSELFSSWCVLFSAQTWDGRNSTTKHDPFSCSLEPPWLQPGIPHECYNRRDVTQKKRRLPIPFETILGRDSLRLRSRTPSF